MLRVIWLLLALYPSESFRPIISRRSIVTSGLSLSLSKPIDEDGERIKSLINKVDNSLYFSGPLDDESIFALSANVINLQRLRVPHIDLHLQSSGGSLLPSLGLVDLIRSSEIPIHTYINGYVASAASLLSIVGTKRYMSKHSVMLIHQLKMGTEFSKYNEIKDYYENSETLMNIIRDIYLDYSDLNATKLEYLLQHDFWLNSSICKEYNLVDEII